MTIKICVGSSCHIKGSPEIVALLQEAVTAYHLENQVTLVGSFCIGKCSPNGVTLQVDEEIHTGINTMNFKEFFKTRVLNALNPETSPSICGIQHIKPHNPVSRAS